MFFFVSRCLTSTSCLKQVSDCHNSSRTQWECILEFPSFKFASWSPEIYSFIKSNRLYIKKRNLIRCHFLCSHECARECHFFISLTEAASCGVHAYFNFISFFGVGCLIEHFNVQRYRENN